MLLTFSPVGILEQLREMASNATLRALRMAEISQLTCSISELTGVPYLRLLEM